MRRFEALARDPALDADFRSYLEIVVTRKKQEIEQNSNPTGIFFD